MIVRNAVQRNLLAPSSSVARSVNSAGKHPCHFHHLSSYPLPSAPPPHWTTGKQAAINYSGWVIVCKCPYFNFKFGLMTIADMVKSKVWWLFLGGKRTLISAVQKLYMFIWTCRSCIKMCYCHLFLLRKRRHLTRACNSSEGTISHSMPWFMMRVSLRIVWCLSNSICIRCAIPLFVPLVSMVGILLVLA